MSEESTHAVAKDPVCGMTVDPQAAAGSATHEGRTYYFCGQSCLRRFRAEPAKFAAPEAGRGASGGQSGAHGSAGRGAQERGIQYTCPMHPEIVRDRPGSCPKCGMALEPRTVTAQEEESPEYRDMRRRFAIGAALSLPVVAIAMDALDGIVARRMGLTSKLGAVLDITADRIVEHVYWITFAVIQMVPLWIPLVVVTRSFVVDAVRGFALARGRTAFGEDSMARSRLTRFLTG